MEFGAIDERQAGVQTSEPVNGIRLRLPKELDSERQKYDRRTVKKFWE